METYNYNLKHIIAIANHVAILNGSCILKNNCNFASIGHIPGSDCDNSYCCVNVIALQMHFAESRKPVCKSMLLYPGNRSTNPPRCARLTGLQARTLLYSCNRSTSSPCCVLATVPQVHLAQGPQYSDKRSTSPHRCVGATAPQIHFSVFKPTLPRLNRHANHPAVAKLAVYHTIRS